MYHVTRFIRTMAIAIVFCTLSETGAFAQEVWMPEGARYAEQLTGAERRLFLPALRNTFWVDNGSSSVYLGKTPLYGIPVFTAVKHTWPHNGGDNCPITQVINPGKVGSIAHLRDREDLINGRILLFSSRKAPRNRWWEDDIVLWTPLGEWEPSVATGVDIREADNGRELLAFGYSNGYIFNKKGEWVPIPTGFERPMGLLCGQRVRVNLSADRNWAKLPPESGLTPGFSGGPIFDLQSGAAVGINCTTEWFPTFKDLLTELKIAEARSPFDNEELGAMGHYGHPEVVKDLLNLIQAKLP